MLEKIAEILTYLSTDQIMAYATNKWVLIVLAIVILLATIFKWRWVLGLLFISGVSLAILRYTRFEPIEGGVDPTLLFFVVGSFLIGGVLIYLLFISGD